MDFYNILSWNIGGLNEKNKQLSVFDISRLNKVGIGALLETKVKGEEIKDVMSSIFTGWSYYSNMCLEGHILLIWKDSLVNIAVIQESDQFLHSRVKNFGRNQEFCLTIVYDSNSLEARRSLWLNLANLQFLIKPWIILGDFNVVFDVDDRIGGRPISAKELEDARQWEALGLVDEMKIMEPTYTWSNKQEGGARIFSKLDRVFKNEEWVDSFTLAEVISQWDVISDHSFILIKQVEVRRTGVNPFRFYNMWSTHSKFREIVLESCTKPLKGRGLEGIVWKLSRIKHVLKKFNWKSMGDVVRNYEESKCKFQQAQANLHNDPMNIQLHYEERAAQWEFSR
ncbi:uncharacterized protein LOC133791965 [Humulus lupulus]|uniref:uncharacterized protein LOC133791965 n=1 Tax=Humulus lupulus TaxID=3486 RepID=UPI002B4136B5|nr:uncharacterized protein LOC133791965 [Humulus lupulus]